MKRKFLTAALLFSATLACFAAAITDMTGKWKGNIITGNGDEVPLTYIFKVDGDKLSGIIQTPQDDLKIYDGKITNDKEFTFKVDVNSNPVESKGKYYGDSVVIDAMLSGSKLHSKLIRVAATK